MPHIKTTDRCRRDSGFAVITVTTLISILLLIGLSVLGYVVSVKRTEKRVSDEFVAVQLAEAGLDKAVFCLNATSGVNCNGSFGLNYPGETEVNIGTGTFTTTITGAGSARTITSIGRSPSGVTSTVKATLTTIPPVDDAAFGYALQAGDGGAYLENGAEISGTLYSNGNVSCQTTQAVVDGDIYVALANGSVDRCKSNYHVHADRILNSFVERDAYYENDPADIAGSTVNGTKYSASATPEREELPDVNLEFWRASAEEGGTIFGDYEPIDDTELGPVKIVGNLNMGNNINVNIKGPVWVVGNIVTGNNSSFSLDPAFGEYSTVILADDPSDNLNKGKIDISNNTSVTGSGSPKSHILFVSTNSSQSHLSPSLSVSNNSAGAVFFATQGVLKIQQNAGAKSLAAHKLHVSQNATINYIESELADMKFSNSPGGIWRLLKGDWRQQK